MLDKNSCSVLYLFDWCECWEEIDFLGTDRTHPFDTDIRWWINFQEVQIQMRRNCDHNWIHWMGHCNQQSQRFLKLTPLLHVSLVTWRSSPVEVVFKICVVSWSGWVRTALLRDSFISTAGSVSDVLDYPRNENCGEKVSTKLSVQQTTDGKQPTKSAANQHWVHEVVCNAFLVK